MLNDRVQASHFKFYLLVLAGMIAVIGSALAFEHLGGYQPCKLCLQQRNPWYVGIPVAALAVAGFALRWPAVLTRGLLLVTGIILVYSVYLGVHHAGVEWGWWPGPDDCGAVEGGLATTTEDLFKQLEETVPPSCDAAPLRILGLSFAGWNALASAVLAAIAIHTSMRR